MKRAHNSRQSRVRWFAILASAIALLAAPGAHAADVPGIGDWEHYHYSLDETPITVVLIHDSGKRDFPVLIIPRSYVYFANGAPSSSEGALPESLETNDLGLAFTEPDGSAWSTAIKEYMTEHDVSSSAAGKALRPFRYLVRLSPNTNTAYAETVRANTVRNFTLIGEPYPGIQEYSATGGTSSFFLGSEGDEFLQAYCYNPLNAVYFCNYNFEIVKDISAVATFLDFRAHGGRDYANRRVRLARQVVCRFIADC